jgi:hypothetical protein
MAVEAFDVSGRGGPRQLDRGRPICFGKASQAETGDELIFARILPRRHFRVLQHNRPEAEIRTRPRNRLDTDQRTGGISAHHLEASDSSAPSAAIADKFVAAVAGRRREIENAAGAPIAAA